MPTSIHVFHTHTLLRTSCQPSKLETKCNQVILQVKRLHPDGGPDINLFPENSRLSAQCFQQNLLITREQLIVSSQSAEMSNSDTSCGYLTVIFSIDLAIIWKVSLFDMKPVMVALLTLNSNQHQWNRWIHKNTKNALNFDPESNGFKDICTYR